MRVSAEEEFEKCARETSTIENTYIQALNEADLVFRGYSIQHWARSKLRQHREWEATWAK